MTSSPSSPWEALRAGFRRVCVRRLVGDEEGAVRALKDEIPALVVGWVKTSSLEPAEKKAKLKEVFDDESARAEELATAFDLFAARFEAKVAARVSEEVSKAREEMLTVASKFENALAGFSESFQEIFSKFASLQVLPENVVEPVELEPEQLGEREEQTSPPPSLEGVQQEIDLVPGDVEVLDDQEPEATALPDTEPDSSPSKEAEPDVSSEEESAKSDEEPVTGQELLPAEQPEDESETEEEPESVPEPEPAPATPRGIRFDEIEQMIDDLLAQD